MPVADKAPAGYQAKVQANTYLENGDDTSHEGVSLIAAQLAPTRVFLLRFPLHFIHDRNTNVDVTLSSFILRLQIVGATAATQLKVRRILGTNTGGGRTLDLSDPEPSIQDTGWDNTATYLRWSTAENEVQQLFLSYTGGPLEPPLGTFTLTMDDGGDNAVTTGAITWNLSASTMATNIQSALDAAAGAGEFSAEALENSFGGFGGKHGDHSPFWLIEHTGSYAADTHELLTADTTNLDFGDFGSATRVVVGGSRDWAGSMMLPGTDFTVDNEITTAVVPTVGSVDIDVTQLVQDAYDDGEHTLELRIGTPTASGVVTVDSDTGSVPPILLCSWSESPGRGVVPFAYVQEQSNNVSRPHYAERMALINSYPKTQLNLHQIHNPPWFNFPPWGHDDSSGDTKIAAYPEDWDGLLYPAFEGNQEYQLSLATAYGDYAETDPILAQWLGLTHKLKAARPDAVVTHWAGWADPTPNGSPPFHADNLSDLYMGSDLACGRNYAGGSEDPWWSDSGVEFMEAIVAKCAEIKAQCGWGPIPTVFWSHRAAGATPAYRSLTADEAASCFNFAYSIGVECIVWWEADWFYWQDDSANWGPAIDQEILDRGGDIDSESDFFLLYNELFRRYLPLLTRTNSAWWSQGQQHRHRSSAGGPVSVKSKRPPRAAAKPKPLRQVRKTKPRRRRFPR